MVESLRDGIVPRRIPHRRLKSAINRDLQNYREIAVELGASESSIISAREVIIDERVRAKCIYPKCEFYGTNLNCPPYAPELTFIRRVVRNYENGILFCVKGRTEDFVGRESHTRTESKRETRRLLCKICAEIESKSFYDGYQFSLAFGQGPCKPMWCPQNDCAGLEAGKKCRFPLKARSSMEAVGMDVFRMAAKRGWEIYPCGARAEASKIPHVLLVGLVLIT